MAELKDNNEKYQEVRTNLDGVFDLLLPTDANQAVEYSEWLKIKTEMRLNQQESKNFPIIKKGVYYINFGKNIGSEQEKDRPAVILWTQQNSPIVIAIPISDEHHGSTFWFHVHLSTGDTALVEQIRTVSKTRIRTPVREKGKIRELLKHELEEINIALDKLKYKF